MAFTNMGRTAGHQCPTSCTDGRRPLTEVICDGPAGSEDDEDGSRRSGRRRKPKRDAYLEEEEREEARKAAALASGAQTEHVGASRCPCLPLSLPLLLC